MAVAAIVDASCCHFATHAAISQDLTFARVEKVMTGITTIHGVVLMLKGFVGTRTAAHGANGIGPVPSGVIIIFFKTSICIAIIDTILVRCCISCCSHCCCSCCWCC